MPDWLQIPVGVLGGIILMAGVWTLSTIPSPLRRRSLFAPRSGRTDDYCAESVQSHGATADCGNAGGDGGQC